MTVTVMRKSFKKMHPRVITYRSYRDFSNETLDETFSSTVLEITFVGNKIYFYTH